MFANNPGSWQKQPAQGVCGRGKDAWNSSGPLKSCWNGGVPGRWVLGVMSGFQKVQSPPKSLPLNTDSFCPHLHKPHFR